MPHKAINKLQTMKKKINVAISAYYPNRPGQNIWSNGGLQHTFFVYLMLKQIPYIQNVWVASDVKNDNFLPEKINAQIADDLVLFDDVIDEVDLLIEMSVYVQPKYTDRIRKRGGKIVTYKFGNDYVMSVESCAFGAHRGWVPHPNRTPVDEVWTNAQHVNTCASFWKHLYQCPIEVLPHLWSPLFLEEAIGTTPQTSEGWPYQGRGDKARVSIFEPNINIVKSSIIPFYAAAKFYDNNPDEVSNIYLLNCLKLAKNPLFKRLVMGTAAGQKRIASAEERMPFVDFIGKYGGIILSHQWENGLNYLFYEALYGGFPLVHNSKFLGDVGYYYREFDIDDGVRALEMAWRTHDENLEEYNSKAFEFLKTVSPYSDIVIEAYDARIRALMA